VFDDFIKLEVDVMLSRVTRPLLGRRCIAIALLAILPILTGVQVASARWKTEDPKCSRFNNAGIPDISTDTKGWFDWWSDCIDDQSDPGPGGVDPPPPPLCKAGERSQFIDSEGRLWWRVCEDGRYKFYPIRVPRAWEGVTPRIQAITLRTDGYTVLVGTARGNREQKVSPRAIKLVHLVRAMMHGAKLPAESLRAVSPAFWASLPKVILKPAPTR